MSRNTTEHDDQEQKERKEQRQRTMEGLYRTIELIKRDIQISEKRLDVLGVYKHLQDLQSVMLQLQALHSKDGINE